MALADVLKCLNKRKITQTNFINFIAFKTAKKEKKLFNLLSSSKRFQLNLINVMFIISYKKWEKKRRRNPPGGKFRVQEENVEVSNLKECCYVSSDFSINLNFLYSDSTSFGWRKQLKSNFLSQHRRENLLLMAKRDVTSCMEIWSWIHHSLQQKSFHLIHSGGREWCNVVESCQLSIEMILNS